MNRGVYDRSETDRLGHALLPLLREVSPSIHPHSHPNWLSNLEDLLETIQPLIGNIGFRCTHTVTRSGGTSRHFVILSNRAGDVFEGVAETGNLATARAAEHLLMSGRFLMNKVKTPVSPAVQRGFGNGESRPL